MMHQRSHQKSQVQSACTNRQPSCKVFVNVMVHEVDALPSKYKMFFFSSCRITFPLFASIFLQCCKSRYSQLSYRLIHHTFYQKKIQVWKNCFFSQNHPNSSKALLGGKTCSKCEDRISENPFKFKQCLDKNFMCCKFYVLRILTGRNIIVQATAKYSKSTGLGKPVAIKSKREKRVWQHHN